MLTIIAKNIVNTRLLTIKIKLTLKIFLIIVFDFFDFYVLTPTLLKKFSAILKGNWSVSLHF